MILPIFHGQPAIAHGGRAEDTPKQVQVLHAQKRDRAGKHRRHRHRQALNLACELCGKWLCEVWRVNSCGQKPSLEIR